MSMKDIDNAQAKERIGEIRLNSYGTPMKIIGYENSKNIIVEFQDEHSYRARTHYKCFILGNVKNPYDKTLYGVAYIGEGQKLKYNNKFTKEANTWHSIMERCYSPKYKKKKPTYENVVCCDEWLCYQNFYEWLHKQLNFDKWLNGNRWAIDKDILVKGNKIYSPETCCLVNERINGLFVKADSIRGEYPVGVIFHKDHGCFEAQIQNQITGKRDHYTGFNTPEKAFLKYKIEKEAIIKQVAKEEYDKGNITKECYEAMLNYEVEITD